MICIMRVWHKTYTPSRDSLTKPLPMKETSSFGPRPIRASGCHSAELVLNSVGNGNNTPLRSSSAEFGTPVQMSDRFRSFGSGGEAGRRASRVPKEIEKKPLNLTIPVADIMVVDMYGEGGAHRTNLTTLSSGFYEFTLENQNGQEILLAFLKANLPKERVMEASIQRTPSGISKDSTGTRSFDMEAFTATRMAERIQQETFAEKLRRKVGHVVSSIEESKLW